MGVSAREAEPWSLGEWWRCSTRIERIDGVAAVVVVLVLAWALLVGWFVQ